MRVALLVLLAALVLAVAAAGKHSHGHPLSEFSFKPPFSGDDPLPRWNTDRAAAIEEDFIRLTHNLRGKRGMIMNRSSFTARTIEITAEVHVHSPSDFGADGMAMWLTDAPSQAPGTAFGGPDKWSGLAVVLDSYDNNGKDEHPYIMLHRNDGTKTFQFAHDGASTAVGGCHANYRNKERTFLHLFIEKGKATLLVDPAGNGEWMPCVGPVDVVMPNQYYISFSAATGGYSDFHDVISLMVGSMDSSALEMYRPPESLLAQVRNNGRPVRPPVDPECVVHSECVNLHPFESITDELARMSESFGHQLMRMQNQISESIDILSESVQPTSANLQSRRSEIQMMRGGFEEELNRLSKLRERISASNSDATSTEKGSEKMGDGLQSVQQALKMLLNEQKSLGQVVDIQLSVLESGTSWWMILVFVLSGLLLVSTLVGLFKPARERHHLY